MNCLFMYLLIQARNAEYNPKRFAAVIMRIREPRTTALIFSSGKMVCTGAKSEEDSRMAARKYARIVQKLGFPVRLPTITFSVFLSYWKFRNGFTVCSFTHMFLCNRNSILQRFDS